MAITVTSSRKNEQFDLNGGGTVRKYLALFYRCTEGDVSGAVSGQSVRLNANVLTTANDYMQQVRDNDVISIFSQEIQRGGVKGALAL